MFVAVTELPELFKLAFQLLVTCGDVPKSKSTDQLLTLEPELVTVTLAW